MENNIIKLQSDLLNDRSDYFSSDPSEYWDLPSLTPEQVRLLSEDLELGVLAAYALLLEYQKYNSEPYIGKDDLRFSFETDEAIFRKEPFDEPVTLSPLTEAFRLQLLLARLGGLQARKLLDYNSVISKAKSVRNSADTHPFS